MPRSNRLEEESGFPRCQACAWGGFFSSSGGTKASIIRERTQGSRSVGEAAAVFGHGHGHASPPLAAACRRQLGVGKIPPAAALVQPKFTPHHPLLVKRVDFVYISLCSDLSLMNSFLARTADTRTLRFWPCFGAPAFSAAKVTQGFFPLFILAPL